MFGYSASAHDRYVTGNYGADQGLCEGDCEELGYDDDECHCDELPTEDDYYDKLAEDRYDDMRAGYYD